LLKKLLSLIILFFFILLCQNDVFAAEKKISKNTSTKKSTSKNVSNKKYATPKKCATSQKTARKNNNVKKNLVNKKDEISSISYLIFDNEEKKSYVSKFTEKPMPIASVTKLMSAMVLLDAGLYMDELIEITSDDIDTIKNSNSRLEVGSVLSRKELLNLALMSSENRATFALARTYPGGKKVFVREMNRKARELGMLDSFFVDPTGLSEDNVSTATDLLKMVNAANKYFLIRHYSTTAQKNFEVNGKILTYKNSNYLVREGNWDINLSKTGFISEAGKCLVMHTKIANHPVIVILLGSSSAKSRIDDAEKLRDIYLAKTNGKV